VRERRETAALRKQTTISQKNLRETRMISTETAPVTVACAESTVQRERKHHEILSQLSKGRGGRKEIKGKGSEASATIWSPKRNPKTL